MTREGDGGAGGRDGEASEGVVPGSTNQRQDAIDRHVAPGWCNEFHRGWKGGSSSASAAAVATAAAEVVVAMAKETEMVDREEERQQPPRWKTEGWQRAGGEGKGESEGGGADARVLHTPLHLLVNRINQRHHGLSPIPLRRRASTFLNLPPTSSTVSSTARYISCCCFFLTSSPSLSSFTTTSAKLHRDL